MRSFAFGRVTVPWLAIACSGRSSKHILHDDDGGAAGADAERNGGAPGAGGLTTAGGDSGPAAGSTGQPPGASCGSPKKPLESSQP